MGPYLPIKIVHAPSILHGLVWEWSTEGGHSDAALVKL